MARIDSGLPSGVFVHENEETGMFEAIDAHRDRIGGAG